MTITAITPPTRSIFESGFMLGAGGGPLFTAVGPFTSAIITAGLPTPPCDVPTTCSERDLGPPGPDGSKEGSSRVLVDSRGDGDAVTDSAGDGDRPLTGTRDNISVGLLEPAVALESGGVVPPE